MPRAIMLTRRWMVCVSLILNFMRVAAPAVALSTGPAGLSPARWAWSRAVDPVTFPSLPAIAARDCSMPVLLATCLLVPVWRIVLRP